MGRETGSCTRAERGYRLEHHTLVSGELKRVFKQDLCPTTCQGNAFVQRHGVDPGGCLNNARVRRPHTVHIRADLTVFCTQRGGENNRRCIRATAAECGDLTLPRHPLEASHNRDFALIKHLLQSGRPHFNDLGIRVCFVGHDAGLRPRKRSSRNSTLNQGHCQYRHCDALTHAHQHVQLAPTRACADGPGKGQQLVCGVSHCRTDDHNLVSIRHCCRDSLSDAVDAVQVSH